MEAAVSRLLGALRDRDRWLLIYDNAEQPATLAPFLPGGAGHVVITSRNPDWRELAAALPVDVFGQDESIALLRDQVPKLDVKDAGRVADAVGNLPLALAQAAAYLDETGTPVDEYLRLLRERTAEILSHGAPASYSASLAAGLGLAFDQLASEEPAGLALLRVAAVLAPKPIPFTLFTAQPNLLPPVLAAAADDPLAFAGLTRQLRRRALARVGPDSLQLHRLVQAILRRHPASPSDIDSTTIAWALLRHAVPVDVWNNPATWPVWRQLLPHVLAVTDSIRYFGHVQAIPEAASWLLLHAASYLHTRGEPRAALPLYERVHQVNSQQLGADHPHTLNLANHLANALHDLGEYQAARTLNEETLARSRRVLGDDHPDTLDVANNLAHVLRALSEYQAARALNEDTLIRRRRVLGDDHPDTLASANGFAIGLHEVGEHQAGRALREDTLARRRRVLGDDHPNTLESAHNLALDVHRAGEHQPGRALHEDTLARHRRVLGMDHPRTLGSASSLANDLANLGEYQAARALDEDTFARYRRVLGDDHPDTLKSANNLANDLTNLGELVCACELRKWIERQRGMDDPKE